MRDAQLVMPKAVSAAMAAWITARRICVQVIEVVTYSPETTGLMVTK